MISQLSSYGKYKDSHSAWIGKVPEHWQVIPNRALFSEVRDRNCPTEEMLSVTIKKGVIKQKALLDGSSKKDSSNLDKSKYKLVRPGDVAYNKMRAWQGALGASSFQGIVSPAYVVMRLRDKQNLPAFFHHLFRTPQFSKEAERWSYGITSDMWSLRPEHFRLIQTPVPPPEEQAAIVKFLDWANGRIDRAIRAKLKIIALLNEQKQAIIHQAVTRGLDPNVEMEASGVSWLGDIPKHWKVFKVKHVSKMSAGFAFNSDDFIESGIQVIRIGNLYLNALALERSPVFLPTSFCERLPRFIVKHHDILLSLTGTLGKRDYAYSVLNESEHPLLLNQRVAVIRANNERITSKFLLFVLRSENSLAQFYSKPGGSKQANLSDDDVRNGYIAIPTSLKEQSAIVDRIEGQLAAYDQVIDKEQRYISLLIESRASLTSDIVTGKLEINRTALELPLETEPNAQDESDTVESDNGSDLAFMEEQE